MSFLKNMYVNVAMIAVFKNVANAILFALVSIREVRLSCFSKLIISQRKIKYYLQHTSMIASNTKFITHITPVVLAITLIAF